MANAEMKGFKVIQISFANNLENNTRIELENKYSYNVKYAVNNTCRGEFSVEVTDKNNPTKFFVKAVVIGIFAFKENVEKQKLHVDTYNMLFPYVRSLITTITVNSGIPAIIIPAMDIENQSIYKIDAKPPVDD